MTPPRPSSAPVLFVAAAQADGAGGWAWTAIRDGAPIATGAGAREGMDTYEATLRAAIGGLDALPDGPVIAVAPRSLQTLATEWLPAWRAAGWRKKKGHIRHLDLVKILAGHLDRRDVAWVLPDAGDPFVVQTRSAARDAADHPDPASQPQAAPSRHALVAYTDGGCRGNPGIGGWGFLLVHTATGRALARRGGAPHTTNNRMEIQAALEALGALNRPGQDIEIRTDSATLCNTATRWLATWKRRGWRKADGEGVKNRDLIERLDALLDTHRVTWTWVKGHDGEPGNTYVDALANAAMDDVANGGDGCWSERFAVSPVRVPRG